MVDHTSSSFGSDRVGKSVGKRPAAKLYTTSRQLGGFPREPEHALPELGRPLGRNACVAENRAQVVGLVRRDRLRRSDREGVGVHLGRVLAGAVHHADVERAGGPAVVALVDHAHLWGAKFSVLPANRRVLWVHTEF